MKKLLAMLEDIWVAVAFAEHDALPSHNKTCLEAGVAPPSLCAAVH